MGIMSNRKQRPVKKWALIAGIVIAAVIACALAVLGAYGGMSRIALSQNFAPGVSVDSIALGDKSLSEGSSLVLDRQQRKLDEISITLGYNGAEKVFNYEALGISGNAKDVLKEAYAYGKTGQFTENYESALKKKSFYSQISTDSAKLRENVLAFLSENDVAAVDAAASMNKGTRKFTYTPEKEGVIADAEAVCAALIKKIEDGNFSPLAVEGDMVHTVKASITMDKLKENTELIGQCVTTATTNENRNNNIRLMCEAVNGQVLQPGQTLSINNLVGERTEAKGFKTAGAIIDGTLTEATGGGICQLAGTLYNAALLADMEIVQRVHHTWPSEYLPVGLDATLNWDDKDLKIRNRSDYPIYIFAEIKNRKVTVEIYGQPQPKGVTIEVNTNILETIPAPKAEVVYTNDLKVGQSKVLNKSRLGYHVQSFRNYIKDGVIIYSELISDDRFVAVQGKILKGTDNVIK